MYLNENANLDFSTKTNISLSHSHPSSWIPKTGLVPFLRGVYYEDRLFVCGRFTDCKALPIGSHDWIDAPSYHEPERNYMGMTTVSGKVFISGGMTFGPSKFFLQ